MAAPDPDRTSGDFLVARNPDEGSTLPYLVRIPLGRDGVVVKARETWPRTSKVYCHEAEGWPADAEVVERVAVRSCTRRGAAIDLVLDRGRENRSQFVFTRARGRQMIFWQSPRTAKQARPNVSLPTRRAAGQVLHVLVDSREKRAYTFSRQQATTERRLLPAGDYGIEGAGTLLAAVERKTLADLASSLLSGKLTYALAELASLPRAAVVVEDRYSQIFKLRHAPGGAVAEALAEAQARFPSVPTMFAETRQLAEEWTYRFLGAAAVELAQRDATEPLTERLPAAGPLPPREPTTAEIRRWAQAQGLAVSDRGRIAAEVQEAYRLAHRTG
jgi:hypothetical protein